MYYYKTRQHDNQNPDRELDIEVGLPDNTFEKVTFKIISLYRGSRVDEHNFEFKVTDLKYIAIGKTIVESIKENVKID